MLFWVFSLMLRTRRDGRMSEEMECMCQQCGISLHIPVELISLEDPANTEVKLLSSIHVCENCGGQLALVGKAGDEPHYRME
jgi:transposase